MSFTPFLSGHSIRATCGDWFGFFSREPFNEMFFLMKRTSLPSSDKQEEDHEDGGRRRREETERSRALSHSSSSLNSLDLPGDSTTSTPISGEISREEEVKNRKEIDSEGERKERRKTDGDKIEGMTGRVIGRNCSLAQNKEGMLYMRFLTLAIEKQRNGEKERKKERNKE